MAVGKTCLVNMLKGKYHSYKYIFEKPYDIVQKRNQLKFDINTLNGFVENQKLFINNEIEKFNKLSDDIWIADRGFEDVEFYTINYPKSINKDWDIEKLLEVELKELRAIRSDKIYYLWANKDELIKRREKDIDNGRKRCSFEHYIHNLYPLDRQWFSKQKNFEFIDTSGKTIDYIFSIIEKKLLSNKKPECP